jgi:YD repeat-containing protein
MVDQSGFTVNYTYDAVGRLAALRDGSNTLIVQYTYDVVGRLARKDNGNGTYTTYAYDAAGELLHLVNYAPDASVNSRFDYTYDASGNRTSESTIDGAWTYTYDAIGELTHAVFVSTNPAIASQDLVYFGREQAKGRFRFRYWICFLDFDFRVRDSRLETRRVRQND